MRVIVTADLHLDPFGVFARLGDRSLRVLRCLGDMFAYAVANEIQEVWILGDVFHARRRVPVRELNELTRMLDWARESGIRVTVVAGNHDYVTNAGDESVVAALTPHVHRVVWEGPERVALGDGVQVVFLPWRTSPGDLDRTAKDRAAHRLIAAGHVALEGAVVACGEYQPPCGVAPGRFEGYTFGVFGHYHKPQTVDSPCPEGMHYVGGLCQHDFGDANSARGFVLLDLATGEREMVPSRGPQFVSIAKGATPSAEDVDGNYLRLEGIAPADEDATRRALMAGGAEGVWFQREVVVEDIRRLPVDPSQGIKALMTAYVDHCLGAKDAPALDRDRLLATGGQILEGAETEHPEVKEAGRSGLRVLRVHMQDFLSHQTSAVRLDQPGITVVTGEVDGAMASSNGAGKSALVEALVWGLYGRTVRGATGDEVVRQGAGPAVVAVDLIDAEGKRWTVTRTQDGKSNPLQVREGAQAIACGDKRATQAWIETHLVGMDYDLFARCTLLGQDSPLLLAATDAVRKAALETLAGTEDYPAYRRVATERCKAAGAVAASREQMAVECRGAVCAILDNRLEVGDGPNAPREARVAVEAMVRTKEAQVAPMADLQAQRDALQGDLEGGEQRQVDQAREDLDRRMADASTRLQVAEGALVRARANVKNLQNACPTCKRPYDTASLEASRTTLDLEVNRCAEAVQKHRAALEQLQAAMATMGPERMETSEAELRAQVAELDAQLGQLVWVREDARALRGVIARLDAWEKAQLEALDAREVERYEAFWKEAWGPAGLQSFVLDTLAMHLTAAAQVYVDALTDGELVVRVHTQRTLKEGSLKEDFHVTATDRVGIDHYNQHSAGERQRVDLALAFAIQDLARTRAGCGVQLLILDEACTNIDAVGEGRSHTLLRQRAATMPIVCITHKPWMQEMGDHLVHVVKRGGISSLAGGDASI